MKRRWLVAGAVCVAIAVPTGFVLAGGGPPAPCARVTAFVEAVRRNASRDDAFEALDDATDAARSDPRWLQLASGLQALRVALEADDADAARTGIDTVRAACDGRRR